ncbi:hypothetical protein BS47DRAFT_1059897 [Hydnum rufescens UP504]|uniref:Uncharacterized protein n=1 Tax=Hydnum rufescens UP504 TaxID=1448309 RepID=A0A9P6DVA4_9AGAM|nr:hypothetical protein BS47DRAFT_1059897 [Hydnum rufescens UP504]
MATQQTTCRQRLATQCVTDAPQTDGSKFQLTTKVSENGCNVYIFYYTNFKTPSTKDAYHYRCYMWYLHHFSMVDILRKLAPEEIPTSQTAETAALAVRRRRTAIRPLHDRLAGSIRGISRQPPRALRSRNPRILRVQKKRHPKIPNLRIRYHPSRRRALAVLERSLVGSRRVNGEVLPPFSPPSSSSLFFRPRELEQ